MTAEWDDLIDEWIQHDLTHAPLKICRVRYAASASTGGWRVTRTHDRGSVAGVAIAATPTHIRGLPVSSPTTRSTGHRRGLHEGPVGDNVTPRPARGVIFRSMTAPARRSSARQCAGPAAHARSPRCSDRTSTACRARACWATSASDLTAARRCRSIRTGWSDAQLCAASALAHRSQHRPSWQRRTASRDATASCRHERTPTPNWPFLSQPARTARVPVVGVIATMRNALSRASSRSARPSAPARPPNVALPGTR